MGHRRDCIDYFTSVSSNCPHVAVLHSSLMELFARRKDEKQIRLTRSQIKPLSGAIKHIFLLIKPQPALNHGYNIDPCESVRSACNNETLVSMESRSMLNE